MVHSNFECIFRFLNGAVYLEKGESAAPPGAAERRPPLYGWWILQINVRQPYAPGVTQAKVDQKLLGLERYY